MYRKSKRHTMLLGTVLAFVMAGTSACSDDDSGDSCEGVADICPTAGDTSCIGDTVQTCEANSDGCLVWTDSETCAAGQQCDAGACVCDDACATGDSQCAGDVVQLCAEDAAGCWSWSDDEDCSQAGETCDDTADAQCISTAMCGDDTVNGADVCDGADLDGQDCTDHGFYVGTLACNATCDAFDTSGCTGECGDDTVNGAEVCDGTDLDGDACTDHGYTGGTLACNTACDAFDFTGCTDTCGDDTINGTDVCDGSDLGGQDCTDFGFLSGTLACTTACDAFDTTACVSSCGDDTINGADVCDGSDLGGQDCTDHGFYTGTLDCSAACDAFDTSGCSETCGDSILNGPEVCDGTDLGSNTCVSLGYSGGTLACNVTCDLDPSGCTAPAGTFCAQPYDLTGETLPFTLTGTFFDDPANGFSCDPVPNNVVWFSYTASYTGAHLVHVDNNTTDWGAYSRLVVTDGTGCAPYGTELACMTNTELFASATVNLVSGSSYLIAFYTDADNNSMVDPEVSISPLYTVDWCNVQWPQTITTEEGQAEVIYGRLFSAGLTDQTTGIDFNPNVVAEVGVGYDGDNPSADPLLFVWSPAFPNVGVANDDEYQATIIVPPAGVAYDYAYRFSADGGATWTYCDRTDNTYDVSDAGDMNPTPTTVTSTPAAFGDLIITEVMQNSYTLIDGLGEWFEVYNPTATDWNLIGCELTDLGSNSHTIDSSFIVPAGGYSTSANSLDPGFTPGYVHPTNFNLGNSDDELYISCGGVDIDSIEWDGGSVWPDPNGATMSLDATATDATMNDDGANWCMGTESYNGDLGSPNLANPACP